VKGLDAFEWAAVESELDIHGHSVLPGLLSAAECDTWATNSQEMGARLAGELGGLRALLYRKLVATANRWAEALGEERRYPEHFDALLTQREKSSLFAERPTLSHLRENEHRGLHQTSPKEPSFPLQISVLLSRPERDFSGGEFVLVEQRPRMQSRPIVVVPEQGDAIIFAAQRKPFRGSTGVYRVSLKHAVSRVHRGERVALELCF